MLPDISQVMEDNNFIQSESWNFLEQLGSEIRMLLNPILYTGLVVLIQRKTHAIIKGKEKAGANMTPTFTK